MTMRTHPTVVAKAKLENARNPGRHMLMGYRVRVPAGTKKVYIPRKHHYHKSVLTEGGNTAQLNAFHNILEPCIVLRGVFGFGVHRCPYHYVSIEEMP